MKKLFLLLVLSSSLLLLQAQNVGNEGFRVLFEQPVNKVVMNDYANVTVMIDESEYLVIEHPGKTLGAENVIYRINGRGILTIEGRDSVVGKVTLHLSPKKHILFLTNDYSRLRLPAGNINSFRLETNDHSSATIDPIFGSDTLQAVNISIEASDYSAIEIHVPIRTDVLEASSVDHAHINFSAVEGRIVDVSDRDFSHISLDRRDLRLGSILDTTTTFDQRIEKILRNHGRRFPSESFTLRFGWAFTNWGNRPYNGLAKLPNAYNLKTTFSSYQLEGTYYLLRTRHWGIGLGLGYESDVYKFSNNFIELKQLAAGSYTFNAIDSTENGGTWNSRLVTRYVNIPITIRWSPDNSFQLGLTLLPGLNYCSQNTDLKRHFESRDREISERVETAEVMRNYKLDVRLTFGWEHFQFFAQIATQPLFKNMSQKAYPFKLGLMLEL